MLKYEIGIALGKTIFIGIHNIVVLSNNIRFQRSKSSLIIGRIALLERYQVRVIRLRPAS